MSRRTPLHRALYWGNIHAAARLLEAGAAVNLADHKVPSSWRPPKALHSLQSRLTGNPARRQSTLPSMDKPLSAEASPRHDLRNGCL